MLALAWMFAAATPSLAQEPAPPAAAAPIQQIRGVIERQLRAFQLEDAAGAWEVVAPGLQARFQTADRFLEMVRSHYAPVYAPTSYSFQDLVPVPGGLGQWMEFVDRFGKRHRALYLMERQADGTWKTMGCLLVDEGPATPQA